MPHPLCASHACPHFLRRHWALSLFSLAAPQHRKKDPLLLSDHKLSDKSVQLAILVPLTHPLSLFTPRADNLSNAHADFIPVLRVLRIFRLIKHAKGVRSLVLTLYWWVGVIAMSCGVGTAHVTRNGHFEGQATACYLNSTRTHHSVGRAA